jgi:Rrf2 family protein
MQITRAGEYAVLGLTYLARQPVGRTIMIEEISDAEHIPKSFLAKIFQSLVKGDIVQSHRGAGGGFSLARPAKTITLLEIINCVEGAFALQKCVMNEPKCVLSDRRMSNCTLCAIFNEAQSRVNEVLANTSLEDLLQPRRAVLENVRAISR